MEKRRQHEENKKRLEDTKKRLLGELDATKNDNKMKEKDMYAQFDTAYTQYQSALETYDAEMEKNNTERIQQFSILQEQKQTLTNLQEQWQERLQENQKREALEAIMRKKKEEQEKEMALLNKAAKNCPPLGQEDSELHMICAQLRQEFRGQKDPDVQHLSHQRSEQCLSPPGAKSYILWGYCCHIKPSHWVFDQTARRNACAMKTKGNKRSRTSGRGARPVLSP